MRPGWLARSALRGIERYRHTALHHRVGDCCRFSPSCSHYAENALRQRSWPIAFLLIVWRLLRCTPLTRRGTVDVVGQSRPGRGRRIAAVLALSGITTLIVAATASAATAAMLPREVGSPRTAGGCDAFVGGVPIGTLTSDHPLQVHKGQRVVLTGQSPVGIRNLPSTAALRAHTEVDIHFINKIAKKSFPQDSTGQNFQKSVNVDTYLKYGSGIYRVDVRSVATGAWDCSATFYVELHGSKLAAEVAVAVGAVGAVGVVVAGNAGDKPDPKPDEQGLVDPTVDPDTLDKVQVKKDRVQTLATSGGIGCLAAFLYALVCETGYFDSPGMMAAVPAALGMRGKRVWVRGKPVLGFFSGLVMGLGASVAVQQFGIYPLTILTAIVLPLLMAVLGAVRGWRGSAWKYV